MTRLALLASCWFSLTVSASAQTTWYVDAAGSPPGSGTAQDPFTSIQYAITRPSTIAGDTVSVSAGTYFENVDFSGKQITVRTTESAIIDANGQGSVVSFVSSEGPGSVLDGFTLRGGRGTIGSVFPASQGLGGGIYCVAASPTLRNLVVEANVAQLGSGLYFSGSAAVVEHCTVRGNAGPDYNHWPHGTGIWSDGPIVVRSTSIVDHRGTAVYQYASRGGGVWGTGTYTDCTIARNWAFQGGGAYATQGLNFVRCTFDSNMAGAEGASAEGGGLFSADPSGVTASACSFTNNVASRGGGAYGASLIRCSLSGNRASAGFSQPGRGGGASESVLIECDVFDNVVGSSSFFPLSLGLGGGIAGGSATRCTIRDNIAYSGGPILGVGGGGAADAELVECDVFGNSVVEMNPASPLSRGGGVLRGSAIRCRIRSNSASIGGGACDAQLTSCTVSGNSSSLAGAGVASYEATAILRSSISWGNTGAATAVVGGALAVSFSNVEGGHPGTGNVDADPLFVDATIGDFALSAGSPCINVGDPALPSDADGSRTDMGAVPFTCSAIARCTGKVNSQGCVPSISWAGTTSLTGTDDFVITGSGFVNQKSGLLFWGRAAGYTPFQGGVLCVGGPLTRTAIQSSGGNPLPPDCSGTYAFSMSHAYMIARAMIPNETIHAQWYARDPAQLDGTGASLSNAIEFTICP